MTQHRLFAVQQEQLTSDDYYTPAWVFERLGLRFDLDVCAPPGGVPWVPAERYYTQAEDGLVSPWFGRVWMNPPFSAPEPWVDKFMQHRNGVCIIPASNGRWFHRLWGDADATAVPTDTAMQFVRGTGGGIPIRIFCAAYGQECVEAIAQLGAVRVLRGAA